MEPNPGDTQLNPRLSRFIGGRRGDWSVTSSKAIIGEPLATVDRLMIMSGVPQDLLGDADWVLRGVTSPRSMTCSLSYVQWMRVPNHSPQLIDSSNRWVHALRKAPCGSDLSQISRNASKAG